MKRENALDALAKRYLAHGKRRASPSTVYADDDAFEDLNALLVPLAHLHVHSNSVAGLHRRPLGELRLFHQLNCAHIRTPRAGRQTCIVSLFTAMNCHVRRPTVSESPVPLRPAPPATIGPAADAAFESPRRVCASVGSRRGCPTSGRPEPPASSRSGQSRLQIRRPLPPTQPGGCTAGNPASPS